MEKIGRYEIEEKIGEGGMAVVYRAYDPEIARTIAIKLLRKERCVDDAYRGRFLREAKAAGTLSHPNIVTIYDVGEVDNTPYIAMELLKGTTLEAFLKSEQEAQLPETLNWSIQLADALEYAHTHGIIHRDIKPSNIILLNDKKTIKITDFGIAHLDESEVTQHTQLGEVLGTPQYMSPEQVLGKPADARSDLFSTGVVMYQLLTGEKPFQADTLATLLFQIATENPAPIGQLSPDLPGTIKQTVDKLLKKKPEKRFQSGKDLKHALQRALKDVSDEEHKSLNKTTLPIKIKWSLLMTIVVIGTLSLCGTYLYQKQKQTLLEQLYAFGSSLSQFISSESAESVLSEDWASIELFVEDTVQKQNFEYLTLVDHTGTIRGSDNVDLLNAKYKVNWTAVQTDDYAGIQIHHWVDKTGNILDFETPIYFQNTRIGTVHLGMSQNPIDSLTQQLLIVIMIIIISTVFAVASVAYVLGKQVTQPIQATIKAMNEITLNHYSYRISTQRADEFGQLFTQFDHMAAHLQQHDENKSKNDSQ